MSTLYRGARLVVGDGKVVEQGDVYVNRGHIAGIGPTHSLAVTADAEIVDLAGLTVMPTIVNPHGHIGYLRDGTCSPENFSRENVLAHLRRLAYYGVSVFQSLGTDRDDTELTIRDQQRNGELRTDMALLFSAGTGLVAPTPGESNGGPFFAADVLHEVSSPTQARAAVRLLAAKRPDAIKFWIDSRWGTKAVFTPDVVAAIIDEAHQHSLRAIAHIHALDDAKTAIRAGIDGLAHMVRDPGPDDELIDMLLERDVFVFTSMSIQKGLTGTLDWATEPWVAATVAHRAIDHVAQQFEQIPQALVRAAAAEYPRLEAELRLLHERGVRFLLSSDTGLFAQFIGVAEHREMEAMALAGIPLPDVIAAATVRPAALLGLDDRGSLTPGKRADLLVLRGNPLEDITHTRDIVDVYLAGERLDRSAALLATE